MLREGYREEVLTSHQAGSMGRLASCGTAGGHAHGVADSWQRGAVHMGGQAGGRTQRSQQSTALSMRIHCLPG